MDKPNNFSDVRCISNFLLLNLGELKMHFLEEIKRWLGEITEIFLLLIAVGIAAGILFGAQVPFFSGVVANLTTLISSLGENGMVGLIALAIIFYLFRRRAVA
jgi:phosphotransferase system  glucose/maltose/N-acetylglucosamine-specific IIC component